MPIGLPILLKVFPLESRDSQLDIPGELRWSQLATLLNSRMDCEGITPAFLSAIAALQNATRAIVGAHQSRISNLSTSVLDVPPLGFSSWGDAERIVVNVDTLYKEFNNDPSPSDIVQMFAMMSKLAA